MGLLRTHLPIAAAVFLGAHGVPCAADDCRTLAYYSLRVHQAWTGTFLYAVQPESGTLAVRFFDQSLNDYSATIRVDSTHCSTMLRGDLAEAAAHAEIVPTRKNHVAMAGGALSINKLEYSRLKGLNLSSAVIPSSGEQTAALKRKAPDPSKIVGKSLGIRSGTLKADVMIESKSGRVADLIELKGIEGLSVCQFTDVLRLLREFRFDTGMAADVRTVLTLDFPTQ